MTLIWCYVFNPTTPSARKDDAFLFKSLGGLVEVLFKPALLPQLAIQQQRRSLPMGLFFCGLV